MPCECMGRVHKDILRLWRERRWYGARSVQLEAPSLPKCVCISRIYKDIRRLWRERRWYGARSVQLESPSLPKCIATASTAESIAGRRPSNKCWATEGFDSDYMHDDLFLIETTCLPADIDALHQAALTLRQAHGDPSQLPLATVDMEAKVAAAATAAAAAASTAAVASAAAATASLVMCPEICVQIVAATTIQRWYRQWHGRWRGLAWVLPQAHPPAKGPECELQATGPLTTADSAKSNNKVYTLEELTDPLIWRRLDVNPLGREMLLPDSRFHELFGFDKDGFQHLPRWRKERLRKTVGFF
mmetsp:Transcript_40701/g.80404  ORF Transcript_40701/g.80404 Transcript_40701/m.80404 type:complete len:303 (-) Transcript_40701:27-935(-)